MRNILLTFLILFCHNLLAKNSTEPKTRIFSTEKKSFVSLTQLITNLACSDVIILGENHGNAGHHLSQKIIIDKVGALSGPVTVGLEFVKWTDQEIFNLYLNKMITLEEFLKRIEWGNSFSFSYYQKLIDSALNSGGYSFGLNAPSWLTRKVSQKGIESLTPQERTLLPSSFQLGQDLYFERFKAVMEGMERNSRNTTILFQKITKPRNYESCLP